ncbi:MAG: UvrD-helicase domain-containing protein [Lyngbya sp.]|nr:UvrD-helicase domain-containing protein [Lyngbya sp.]
MYIYTTPRFDQQARQHGIQSQVAELLVAIKTQGITAVEALFERNYPYLKRPVRNLRLVGKIRRVDASEVLCLLDVFTRGGKEYEAFLRNPEEYGKLHLEPAVDPQQLAASLKLQREEQHSVSRRQALPEKLYHLWLERPSWARNTADIIICESEVWVNQFKQRETQLQWKTFHEIITNLVGESQFNNGIRRQNTNWLNVYLCGKPSEHRYILYSLVQTVDLPHRNVLFLLATFDRDPALTELANVGQVTHVFDPKNTQTLFSQNVTFDDLSRYTRRSYPGYLILDAEVWLELEQEAGINLALSVEEEEILHELSTAENHTHSLPVFINGRAGSGKSTMLVYLFADYCDRYQKFYLKNKPKKEQDIFNPLFLTYNEKLLSKAQEAVEKLLNNHHKYVLDSNGHQEERPAITDCFQSFQQFLLNQLPPEHGIHFDPDKYISFYDFRQHCSRRHSRYSPELCWHIIRTFIKGYTLTGQQEGYMTPEDYEEVPRRERTISPEIFKAIYQQVWSWYHQLTTREGYWDDQDLIRKVLELQCFDSKYTAIFCDEAQDFTKLELRLIMQLSAFSQCDLYPPVHSLPFAFAGDPFQTLNPTGFRWESVKAAFFDQVIAVLDPSHQLNLNMTFYELESNYRSSLSIVKVTNLIHLWRHLLFQIQELKPQAAWQPYTDSHEPQKFIFGQRGFSAEALKRHVEKSPIFIVPCEAGGELQYIKNDEFLASLFPQVSEENPPKNVLSAIQAKGLEFPLVILYKFGEQFAQEFQRPIWDYLGNQETHPLELEYFFNKLYVAASRGMSDLIVIDTEVGDRLLWQYATSDHSNQLDSWLQQLENRILWESAIGGLRWGDNLGGLDRDNRASQAKEFEENGRSQKDATSLRRAEQFYRELGNLERADLCLAWALKFEKKFREAGEIFLQRGKQKDAWSCFWEGTCWQALMDWYQQFPEQKPIERSIVEFMAQTPKTLATLKRFTHFLEDNLASKLLVENRLVKPWKVAIQEYSRLIRNLMREKHIEKAEWQKLGDVLEGLDEAKYHGLLELAGDCFYRAQNLRRAVRCWRESGATNKREYNLAEAELIGYPEGFPYLEKVGDYQRIVGEWENAGKPGTQQWLKYIDCIGQALEKQNRQQDWIEYLIRTKRWVDGISALEKLPKADTMKFRFELVRQLSRSSLTPEQARDFRSRYVSFIEKVLSHSQWREELSVEEIGVALERVGELVPTLRFYEKFVNSEHPHLSQFARKRWIATKLKQQDYASIAEPKRAGEIRQEIARKAYDWVIIPAEISPEPPRLDVQPTIPGISSKDEEKLTFASDSDLGIVGLPPGTKIKLINSEIKIYSFQIAHLEVKRVRRELSLWVLLRDTVTSSELQVTIDRKRSRIKVGDVMIDAFDGHQLRFGSPERDYKGTVFYSSEQPRIELQIRGIANKIYL